MYGVWLESCGYRVTVARSLASARKVARKETIDVLVIDALFGGEFRRVEFQRRWTRLAHRDPLAIVVLSGYLPDAHLPRQPATHELCAFKPCLPQQLSGLIEDLLLAPPHGPIADKGKPLPDCLPS